MMECYPVPVLRDNYVWLIVEPRQRKVLAVDPGEAAPVAAVLQDRGLQLSGILLTHHHGDHAGGIPGLLSHYPDVPVYAAQQSPHAFVSVRLREGETVQHGALSFSVLEIPGHTLDHLAFVGEGSIFCGDTLFSGGCGRIFEGTVQMMYATLQKIAALPAGTAIYCGHEYTRANLAFAAMVEPDNPFITEKISKIANRAVTLPSVLREEKWVNPFLRCTEQTVNMAAAHHAGRRLASPVEVFGVLRAWKNQLK